MKKDGESKKSSIIRQSKNQMKTMRQMRLKLYQKKLTKKNLNANKKFSVVLTKEEIEQKISHFKKIYGPSSSYQICLQALYYPPFQRTFELNNMIGYHLRNLKKFIHKLSDLTEEDFELTLFNISSHLNSEKYNKNEIICRYGDKADKFYIVLKGKVIFLVPEENKYYMTEEEYIEHLMKLRENQEFEIIRNILNINQYIFEINNNNEKKIDNKIENNNNFEFDEFILNSLDQYQKKKENKYSIYLYEKFKEFKNNREKEKINNMNNLNNTNNFNDYNDYIKLINVNLAEMREKRNQKNYNITKNNKASKKKLVTILEYQRTNIFDDGDTFGAIGITTKKSKRTAACICYENCYLGTLTKNEYNEFLEKIIEKISNKLYDLIIKNNIFENMLKNKFVMKYAHMFRYEQYNKDSIILNEKDEIKSLIILYEGEFSLSVNINLIELNELIIQYKKINNKLNDDIKKNDKIEEIEENKKLLIKMKDYKKDIKDIITEKNNFILTKINNSLILGYPNTVDPETNLSLINCKCISNVAKAYVIEKEMLKYIDKENKYIRKSPDIIKSKIELILKRLIELRALIIKKIKDKKHFQNNLINNNEIISRNLEEKKRKNLSTLVDFSQKIISKNIPKNNLLIKNRTIFSEVKTKKDIFEKELLLNKAQYRSQKFLLEQKSEQKKLIRTNIVNDKEKYKDLSLIFSNNPNDKKSFLDKVTDKLKKEDNILGKQINIFKLNIKNGNSLNLELIKEKKQYNNNNYNLKTMKNIDTENTFNCLYNKFFENFKAEKKINIDNINDTFTSFYTNNTTLFNLKNKFNSNLSGKNIHNINLNDRDIKCFNKNYQDSYNELFLKYISDKFKNQKRNINIDDYKTKIINTTPNQFVFPSIFTPKKIKKNENKKEIKKRFKFIPISKYKNINVDV